MCRATTNLEARVRALDRVVEVAAAAGAGLGGRRRAEAKATADASAKAESERVRERAAAAAAAARRRGRRRGAGRRPRRGRRREAGRREVLDPTAAAAVPASRVRVTNPSIVVSWFVGGGGSPGPRSTRPKPPKRLSIVRRARAVRAAPHAWTN